MTTAIACFFMFLLLSLAGVYVLRSMETIAKWPATEACIEEIKAVSSFDSEDTVGITVRFTVSGTALVSSERWYDTMPCSNSYTDEFIARHPKGSSIQIYYNPKNPQQFYLFRRSPDCLAETLFVFATVLCTIASARAVFVSW